MLSLVAVVKSLALAVQHLKSGYLPKQNVNNTIIESTDFTHAPLILFYNLTIYLPVILLGEKKSNHSVTQSEKK